MNVTHILTRSYFGGADPEGEIAQLENDAVVLDGWAAHEANRRQARWASRPHDRKAEPMNAYHNRTFISGQDALESLVNARVGPLGDAVERLASAMEAFETCVLSAHAPKDSIWEHLKISRCQLIAIPGLTSEDIRGLALETNTHALRRGSKVAESLAYSYASGKITRTPDIPALPALPTGIIDMSGKSGDVNKAIIELETKSLPRAKVIELYRGKVAAVLDGAASAFEQIVGTRKLVN